MWWPCFSSDIWGLNCLRNIQVGNSLEPSQIDAVSSSEWNVLWVKCILHLCRLHYQFCLLLVMLNGFCKGNHNTQGSSKSEVKLGRISSKDMMWFDIALAGPTFDMCAVSKPLRPESEEFVIWGENCENITLDMLSQKLGHKSRK